MNFLKITPKLSSTGLILLMGALVKFLLQLINTPEYGFFGDELYTIALSRHLAFGYVDLPPLVPAMAALSRGLLGESLFVYRVFPALAGSATLVFVGLLTKEFGGKTFALLTSVLGFIAIPLFLGFNSIFCYDGFDLMVLAGFLYVLVRYLRIGNQKLWLLLGLIAGLAALTKMTILFIGPGFLIALLFSRHRKDLLTPWPWLGALIFILLVSPYLYWQFSHGWPTLEYWNNYGTIRMGARPPLLKYLVTVLVTAGPLLAPLWLAGFLRLLRPMNDTKFGFLGILFLVTAAVLYVRNTQVRMLIELYLPLMAAGAVLCEEIASKMRRGGWLQVAVLVYLFLAAIEAALTALPFLPFEKIEAYVLSTKPLHPPYEEFGQKFYVSAVLSGKRGWPEFVNEVAQVYDELPAQDQAVAGIWADWYAPAAAIDYYAPQLGLPHAVSGHLTYHLWGPSYTWDVMVVVTNHSLGEYFETCEFKKEIQHPYVYVGSPSVYVCREPDVPVDVIWSRMKAYR